MEPLFRLVHGLTGSGKSKLLLWLRTYFEEVWKWSDGVQFQFVAPLNSMANNIGGSTMHTWAGLTFTNSEGVQISGDMLQKGKDNISRRQVKCAKLRYLFIDEVVCRWNSLHFLNTIKFYGPQDVRRVAGRAINVHKFLFYPFNIPPARVHVNSHTARVG